MRKKSNIVGIEALDWPGVRREHPGSIRSTSNAARRDASVAENEEGILARALRSHFGATAKNVKLRLTGPLERETRQEPYETKD